MIIDPDFFEHWRTRMLIDALGKDEMAPMYVMRIWAHCQSRRSTTFAMPANGLKALCHYAGNAEALELALIASEFIARNGQYISVDGWAEHNEKLIANWKNGAKGGRPAKSEEEPTDNPEITHNEPTETHKEPIGGEEIGEDKILKPTTPNGVVVGSDPANPPPVAKEEKPDCPHQQIIAIYHEVLPQCPRIREWTPARATQLRTRWNEDKRRQNLDYWREFFEYVASCNFLVGLAPPRNGNEEPFIADLEWIVKSANFTKIREGKYAKRRY